jgi:hypothetical protein
MNILLYLQGAVNYTLYTIFTYVYIIYSQVVLDSFYYPYNCVHHNGDGSLKGEDQLHAPTVLPQQKPLPPGCLPIAHEAPEHGSQNVCS